MSADRGREVVAHGGTAGVGVQPLARLEVGGLKCHDTSGPVARHDDVTLVEFLEEGLDEAVRIDRLVGLPILGEDHGITDLPLAAPSQVLAVGRLGFVFQRLQLCECLGEISMDGQVDRQGRLGQFGLVDIDHDRVGGPGEGFPVVADLPAR